jgi:hypothetical protein
MLVTAGLLGLLSASLGIAECLANPAWFHYIVNGLRGLGDSPLPGVIQNTGSVSRVVYGSLWSLQAEVFG